MRARTQVSVGHFLSIIGHLWFCASGYVTSRIIKNTSYMKDTKQLGIENLKRLITAVAAQAAAAFSIDANGDGKISTGEYTSFGTGFLLAALGNAGTAQAAFPEIKDIEGDEFGQLTKHVIATKFLPDSEAEAEKLIKLVVITAYLNKVMVDTIIATSKGEPIELDLEALVNITLG